MFRPSQSSGKPAVTVAVLPFESKGRFDRLRPLELGIRDLVTARLLELSGASFAKGAEGEKAKAVQPLSFQVLQRSNMEQLLRKLALIQSGFSDKSKLSDTLPLRGEPIWFGARSTSDRPVTNTLSSCMANWFRP